MFVAMTLGWVMAILASVLILYVAWFLFFPVLFAITPKGVFDQQLGFMTIDTQSETFLYWIAAAVAFGLWWYITPALVRAHAWIDRELLSNRTQRLEQRVKTLSESRADTVDFSAAELRRIERDLHDGAQARLVSLGMSLGMADEIIEKDPEAARRLLAEARTTTTAALGDLRSVVRGMHPPVLADRGLVGAVQALALDMAIPVMVSSQLNARPPAPVESACYFAVAESLANVAKHSGARRAWVQIGYGDGRLQIEVGDDGQGGASADLGTGLVGVARRLAAFDGTMALSSPSGGPTIVSLEVPCVLSSGRTTPSSGTG
jgi:signal transduction histidine kinase